LNDLHVAVEQFLATPNADSFPKNYSNLIIIILSYKETQTTLEFTRY